ncbi:MAG: FixH family protein [Gammaproteobacteria bacterium]|nr:FixH family protein [Gammaproteobacteria bacterium]
MMNAADSPIRNWKREPLVWMLIAIPLSAVIMGVVMITLAIQSFSGLVVDDYYKKGKQINRVLARDQLAYELDLAATFSIDTVGGIKIRFDPGVSVIPGERIELKLVHATRPGLDQQLFFDIKDSRLLESPLELPGRGRWNLILQTPDWRLTGSLQHPDQRNAQLLPNYNPE